MAIERIDLDSSAERVPPHSIEAEEAVLGSILIDRDAIQLIAHFLAPTDFYRQRNATIFNSMLEIYNRREQVDYLTLVTELQRSDQYDEVGGLAYLSGLLTVVPTSVHVESYARIVERVAVMRRLITAGARIAGIGYQNNVEVDEALEQSERFLMDVAQRRVRREFESLSDILQDYLNQLPSSADDDSNRHGIPTGFIDLDKITGGFQRSDLIILAARPSMGKTSLALNIAENVAIPSAIRRGDPGAQGGTVAVFSIEMSKAQLAGRMLATESTVDSSRIRQGRLSDSDWRKITHAIGILGDAPIYIDDTPGISIVELRSKARRLHADRQVDLIVVDYLQLINGSGSDNRVQEVSEISRSLKALARELDVPVLALSQLSRAVESRSPKIPMLSDLRESGSIEQDADLVLFIYREDFYDRETEKKGIAELHVAKHRNGPTGQINLLFMDRTTRFVDLETFRE
jgi:replicative DNA helicase